MLIKQVKAQAGEAKSHSLVNIIFMLGGAIPNQVVQNIIVIAQLNIKLILLVLILP
jgi:hypothetical protein